MGQLGALFLALLQSLREAQAWNICGIRGCFCDASRDSADCGGLFFETIPRLPPWLRRLRITGGHVTALGAEAFRGAPQLADLELSDSDLAFLHNRAFADLNSLTRLDLSGNALSTLPPLLLRDSRRLSDVSLAYNPIVDLADVLAALPHRSSFRLHSLFLAGTLLSVARHDDILPNLAVLDLSFVSFLRLNRTGALMPPSSKCEEESCRFMRIEWASLSELHASKANATLTTDFLLQLSNLTKLSIGGNNLAVPDSLSALYGFKNVVALNLSSLLIDNKRGFIPSWDIFPPSLQILDISGMGIQHIDTDFVGEDNDLTHLFATDNAVKDFSIPPQLRQLELLDLSGNLLSELPKLIGWTQVRGLEHLDLSRNRIERLDNGSLTAFPGLRVLRLARNALHRIAPAAFPTLGLSALRHLDLSGNNLLTLPAALIPSLRSLDLSHNNLRSLHSDFFLGMPDLTSLNLSYNRQLLPLSTHCSSLSLEPATSCFPRFLNHMSSLVFLSTLDLSATGLVNLPPNLLTAFRLLNVLQLSGNLLSGDVWDNWQAKGQLPPCIVVLDLGDNLITYISNVSFAIAPGSCLEKLSLAGNPFECDCRLAPLRPLFFSSRDGSQRLRRSDLIADSEDPDLYYCEGPGLKEPLSLYLESARGCGEEKRQERVLALSLGIAFFLASVLALAMVWRLGVLCGRRVSHHMHYIYRPLATMPSNLSSPVHL